MKDQKLTWYSIVFFIVLTQVLLLTPSQVYEPQFTVTYPSKADVVLEGFTVVQVPLKGGKVEIKAEHANVYKELDFVELNFVKSYFEDEKSSQVELESKKGKYFSALQEVEGTEDVKIKVNQGYQMETPAMKYNHKSGQVSTQSAIRIVGPVATEPELILKGNGLDGNVKKNEFRVLTDIFCEKLVPQNPNLRYTIRSDTLFLYPGENKAVFDGGVKVEQEDFHMTSEKYEVFFKKEQKDIDQAVASGKVIFWQGERHGKAEEAVFLNAEKRIILKGNPEVQVGEGTLRGEVIVFHTDTEKIESFNVQGDFQQKGLKI
ncbi:MAG TPA: LPS export ABC transporter periplasmic protein LptC [Bdellovibrionota bacterium]|nr:LPS export ABC transporter periplasmic protein LptC [Bdellovibrionota bacterium]